MNLSADLDTFCQAHRILRDQSTMGPEERAGIERAKLVTQGEYIDSGRGVVLAALGGRDTLLGCSNSVTVNGDSGPLGENRFCVVTNSMLRSLAWLCASAWASNELLPGLGNLKGPSIGLQPTAIPPGLELVWWSVHFPTEGDGAVMDPGVPSIAPQWLPRALQRLDAVRQQYMTESFRAAVDYLWLHEAAHVVCGHFDNEMRSNERIRAMEIEADRWSMLRVFEDRHLHAEAVPGNGDPVVTAAVLGICLAHILSFAKRVLNGETGWHPATSKYPPLWFRTDDILRMEGLAARHVRAYRSEVAGESGESPGTWELKRAGAHCFLQQGLLDLCNVHPLFGQWLGPAIDGVRNEAGEEIMKRARNSLRRKRSA